MTRPRPAVLGALAIGGVLLMYVRTLGFGLFWDDFEVLRPWTFSDLRHAWTGEYRPWEAIAFYRPLTATYYALISDRFGFHAAALHVIPLVALAGVAVLTAIFVARESDDHVMAGLAAVLVSTLPTLGTSMGPWIANQYHAFMTICFIAALLIWQRGRGATRAWWWRALPWLVAAAWFKEDGLLLAIAIGAAQWARGTITRDLPRPSSRAWIALAAITLLLIGWRAIWLPSQFGYGLPTLAQMAANLQRAPRYVLLWQVGPPAVAWPAMAAKALVLVTAAWVLLRARTSPGARLIVTGLTVMLFANAPLAMVSSEGRWHLVGWGAVLVTSGALGEWIARAPRWGWPAASVTVIALAISAGERIATFAPCSADSREHYREMAEVTDLPAELHAWLVTRDAACASGTFADFDRPMDALTWRAPVPALDDRPK